jgi:hypothetical protein
MSLPLSNSTRKLVTGAACLLLGASAFWMGRPAQAQTSAPRVYELRTYHCAPGKLEALKARFREHTTQLFEKHGMHSVAYWTPADAPASSDTLIYILSHPSREAAAKNWDAFKNDPEWIAAKAASEKDGRLVEKVDDVYMNATDFSPLK